MHVKVLRDEKFSLQGAKKRTDRVALLMEMMSANDVKAGNWEAVKYSTTQ